MRAIKFRGQREDTEKWVYGSLIEDKYIVGNVIDWNEDYFNTEYWWKVIPETVGQFTGLYDKNGKEIYEGDLVSAYKDLTEMYSRGSVENGTLEVWEEVVGNIDIPKEIVEYIGSSFHIGEYYLDTIEDCELEVIGNICDNKELL